MLHHHTGEVPKTIRLRETPKIPLPAPARVLSDLVFPGHEEEHECVGWGEDEVGEACPGDADDGTGGFERADLVFYWVPGVRRGWWDAMEGSGGEREGGREKERGRKRETR